MTTEQIYVKNDGTGMEKALAQAERVANYYSYPKRPTLHVRLLVEETLGMVRAITGDFRAIFWIESTHDDLKICLEAKTDMNPDKRRELISVSSSKKNEKAKGIMGKIRELFEIGVQDYNEANRIQNMYELAYLNNGMMSPSLNVSDAMNQGVFVWSLEHYKGAIQGEDGSDEEAADELEKSIVANLADDVKVGIRKDSVEMVVYKKIPWE